MNHTEAILVLRDMLRDGNRPGSDSTKFTWSDVTLARYLSLEQNSIFRDIVKASEVYFNERVLLCAQDAVQQHTSVFEYELPPWAFNVIEQGVRLTATDTEGEGAKIHPARDVEFPTSPSWRFDGSSTFRLYDTEARDLTIQVAKIPGPPISGTQDIASRGSDEIVMEADATATFNHDLVPGAYRGTIMEITGATGSASADIVGEQRRVIDSRVKQVATNPSVFRLVLTVSKAFTRAVGIGHSYVSLLDTGSMAHEQYLLLMTKMIALGDTDNPIPESMAAKVRVESARFLAALKRRENVGAREMGSHESGFTRNDPDRDSFFSGF